MTDDDKSKGRPSRHKDERLSKNRTFRVRDQLDQQLREAAKDSGRSVSEEIEHRLTRSFMEDRLLARIAELEHQQTMNEERIAMAVTREMFRSGKLTFNDSDGKPMKSGFVGDE